VVLAYRPRGPAGADHGDADVRSIVMLGADGD
jgi:hypothetical protein